MFVLDFEWPHTRYLVTTYVDGFLYQALQMVHSQMPFLRFYCTLHENFLSLLYTLYKTVKYHTGVRIPLFNSLKTIYL